MALLEEVQRGKSSFFHSYLTAIPNTFLIQIRSFVRSFVRFGWLEDLEFSEKILDFREKLGFFAKISEFLRKSRIFTKISDFCKSRIFAKILDNLENLGFS